MTGEGWDNPVSKAVLVTATQLVMMKFAVDRVSALRLMHDAIEEILREECNRSSSPKS